MTVKKKRYQTSLPASLCRAQEAHYRARATDALLENVRIVSEKAAGAWSREALAAERREARLGEPIALSVPIALAEPGLRDEATRTSSENPDRGFYDS